MKSLQSLNQVLKPPSEPLRNAHIEILAAIVGDSAELRGNFFLTKSVILKFLGCRGWVHMRREGIVQTELAWKYVHHDKNRVVGVPVCPATAAFDFCRLWTFDCVMGKPVQSVFASERAVGGRSTGEKNTYEYVSNQSELVLEHSMQLLHKACGFSQK